MTPPTASSSTAAQAHQATRGAVMDTTGLHAYDQPSDAGRAHPCHQVVEYVRLGATS
jgi:hypothetical protein